MDLRYCNEKNSRNRRSLQAARRLNCKRTNEKKEKENRHRWQLRVFLINQPEQKPSCKYFHVVWDQPAASAPLPAPPPDTAARTLGSRRRTKRSSAWSAWTEAADPGRSCPRWRETSIKTNGETKVQWGCVILLELLTNKVFGSLCANYTNCLRTKQWLAFPIPQHCFAALCSGNRQK